ncbi:MAG: class I SAM-dependent methyltransferase, partial [Miltoncostaeaceae bacterium]
MTAAARDREVFDHIAPRYDVVSRVMTLGRGDRWRQAAARAADLCAGAAALDACTGTGDLALMLADRVTPLGEVVGVDHSPEMITRARMKAQATGRHCRFQVGDCTDFA